MFDYNEIIQREILPDLVDTVIYQSMQPWEQLFGMTPYMGGDRITSRYRLTHTSNAAAYDKSDVDPAASTQVLGKPYWTKVFYHSACEVSGIDISNERPSMQRIDLIRDAIALETRALMDVVVTAFYTQLKKDVDSSSVAYSDASLSRSTYTTLASYEEATDAAITLAYMRGMINNVLLDHPVKLQDYICLCEEAVYNKFRPLAAALHSWTLNDPKANQNQDMGYQNLASFNGLQFANPQDFYGMTTGDVLMLRKQDVNIVNHRPFEIVPVESGRDSTKFVLRVGYNIYVDNPGYQGKMTSKD